MNGPVDISIVIPSYNRGRGAAENLAKCLALQPQAKEIIVVDDHSDVEDEDILRDFAEKYACVHYIRLPENGGQAVSRSIGMATASGKYIVSLDDDSWFLDDNSLQRVWDRMESLPQCGILSFAAFSPGQPVKPSENRLMLVADHITCGAAYRREILRRVGYHIAFLRFEGEESDLSLKVMGGGFDVVLDKNIRVFHDYNPSKRSRESLKRVRQFAVRNDMLRSIIYFQFPSNVYFAVGKAVTHFIFGLKHGDLWATFRGYGGFIKLLPIALCKRHTLPNVAMKRYLRLRKNPESYSK